ncbi:MAG TPA: DsbA family protein [Thermoanaerobaculia bacterium]|nr:DsbA family protein [Thermoanaerobaculia bacterium]
MNPAQSSTTSGRRALLLLASGALLFTFGWMLAGGASLEAKTDAAAAADTKAAVVNGVVVTVDEVTAKAKERLDDLDLQHQQMEMKFQQERTSRLLTTLGELLEERMLDLEAKATGKTKDQLIDEGVKAKAGTVTDAEVDAYYEQLKTQQPQGLPPKESIAERIKQYLQAQKDQNARNAYFTDLKAKYKVETYLTEPRVEIATEGHPAKGPATAPVTIVEFSDFQCPYCRQVVPTLDQITQKYGDQVRLVFRQFPLTSIHPFAQKAAEAALCANEQGKFWQMHDAMFGDQTKLEVAALKTTAAGLGVDKAKFDECLDSGRFAERIKEDEKAGALVGVSGTPAIFINGRSYSGAQPFDVLSQVIDEEIAKAKNGKG